MTSSHQTGRRRIAHVGERLVASTPKRLCYDDVRTLMNADESRQTHLHTLCQVPSTAIDELLQQLIECPRAASTKDHFGRTPLLHAVKNGCSPQFIRVLFEFQPEAVSQRDFCGESALMGLYHKSCSPLLLETVLDAHPSLALQNMQSFSGQTLLEHVCNPWELVDADKETIDKNATMTDSWTKLVLTVVAAYQSRFGSGGEPTTELHMAIELACSPKIVAWFATMYPEQTRLLGGAVEQLLPLHLFVSLAEYSCEPSADTTLAKLLRQYPRSTHVEHKGNHALHLAIGSGWTWHNGLRTLFYAGPHALCVSHPKSWLLPFMVAATVGACDLDTVYNLLRECPINVLG